MLPVGIVSWILIGTSDSIPMLVVSRALQGFVYEMLYPNSALYIAEMSHTSIRWKLKSTVDLFQEVGALYLVLLGSSLSWRMTSIICGVSTMILPMFAILILPHSPKWLASRGRHDEALNSLTYYRDNSYDVHSEMADIKKDLQETRETRETKNHPSVKKFNS